MLFLLWSVSSVQSLSWVLLFATPWTAARQASLSITNSQSPPKPMSIELVMSSNHLILCHPLLLLPSIFPSIRVSSNESALCIRWPKYWSFSFDISIKPTTNVVSNKNNRGQSGQQREQQMRSISLYITPITITQNTPWPHNTKRNIDKAWKHLHARVSIQSHHSGLDPTLQYSVNIEYNRASMFAS